MQSLHGVLCPSSILPYLELKSMQNTFPVGLLVQALGPCLRYFWGPGTVEISGKPEEHGAYERTLVGPRIGFQFITLYVHPYYGPAIPNIAQKVHVKTLVLRTTPDTYFGTTVLKWAVYRPLSHMALRSEPSARPETGVRQIRSSWSFRGSSAV